jgi:membrane protein YqaA with SNARE-associated domain
MDETGTLRPPRWNPLHRLYRWVLHWADTPYGTPALFGIAVIESSFFPIPPDILLIALAFTRPDRAWWNALVCSVGSVLGGVLGWVIGYGFYATIGQPIITTLGYTTEFALVGRYFEENAFLAILTAAFTPIPYKVFTIAAGVWQIPLLTLVLASIVGRSGRFFLVAGTIYWIGPRIKPYLDRYFDLFTLILLGLLVAGYLGLRWFTG